MQFAWGRKGESAGGESFRRGEAPSRSFHFKYLVFQKGCRMPIAVARSFGLVGRRRDVAAACGAYLKDTPSRPLHPAPRPRPRAPSSGRSPRATRPMIGSGSRPGHLPLTLAIRPMFGSDSRPDDLPPGPCDPRLGAILVRSSQARRRDCLRLRAVSGLGPSFCPSQSGALWLLSDFEAVNL